MAQQLYRECMITIAEPGFTVKQIMGYNDSGESAYGLRVGFRVNRSLTPVADNATVRIYNLAPGSRALLAQRSIYLTRKEPIRYLQIHAGYEGSTGAIFNGVIVRVFNLRDGPDWITTIEASAALAQALANTKETSWDSDGGVSVETIVRDLFSTTNLGAPTFSVEASQIISSKFLNSYVASGSAYKSIEKVLSSLGLSWSAGLEGVVVVKPGYPKDSTNILDISEYTGMIGSPKVSDVGAEIRTLLDPRVSPGTLVEIFSDTLDESTPGLGNKYTVWSMEMVGDTHADDWYSNINALFYPPVTAVMAPVAATLPLVPQEDEGLV